MPEYSFCCEECKNEFSFFWTITNYESELQNAVCPECSSQRIYRDFGVDAPHCQVRNVTTVAQLAERNEKKFGKELTEKMRKEHKTKREVGMEMLPEGMSRAKETGFTDNYTREDWSKKGKIKKKKGKKNE